MRFSFPIDVGVIGGADGPTVIFVAASPFSWIWLGAGLLIAAVCFFLWRRKKRKK